MIEIKKCNYITGDSTSVSFGLSKIIDFLETAGRTPLFLSCPLKSISLKYFIKTSKIDFLSLNDLSSTLSNTSNLFRVDLIVIDLWHLKTVSSVLEYKEILDKTGIDYIIVSSKYHYKEGDDVRIYKIERGSDSNINLNHIPEYRYNITEKVGGWKSTMDDLILSYKRDKKIDDIFKGDE